MKQNEQHTCLLEVQEKNKTKILHLLKFKLVYQLMNNIQRTIRLKMANCKEHFCATRSLSALQNDN